MKQVRVDGMQFINEDGHQVIMNGINLVCKKRENGYLESNSEELIETYYKRGFNLIRLGIFWDGVEPEPGKFNEAYLDQVLKVIQKAEETGVYILVDMHQDLFGVKYGDGAPDWATLDEGLYHPENCTMWYEAYLSSQAIMRAADNFWANKEASDGVGLLDHYEAMWEYLSGKFQSFSNIVGIEPMNEPYMGSIAPQAFGAGIAAAQNINPAFDIQKGNEASPEERAAMQNTMSEHFKKFDKEILMPFYNRILRAIRRKGNIPLATGGNIYSSSFVDTGIDRVIDEKGEVDKQQIYAPHGYDAVVDTDNYAAFSKENVEGVFAQKRTSQERLQVPVIVGEWGAFPSKDFTNTLIEHMTGILEKYLWSSTYWVYYSGMENDLNYSSLERGYPVEIAGNLQSYHYDYSAKTLHVVWEAKKDQESLLYIPDIASASSRKVDVTGQAEINFQPIEQAIGGYVKIYSKMDQIIEVRI